MARRSPPARMDVIQCRRPARCATCFDLAAAAVRGRLRRPARGAARRVRQATGSGHSRGTVAPAPPRSRPPEWSCRGRGGPTGMPSMLRSPARPRRPDTGQRRASAARAASRARARRRHGLPTSGGRRRLRPPRRRRCPVPARRFRSAQTSVSCEQLDPGWTPPASIRCSTSQARSASPRTAQRAAQRHPLPAAPYRDPARRSTWR